jgi:tetratricopeptide (TPR) repeat protein
MGEGPEATQLVSSGWAFYAAGNTPGAMRDFKAALAIAPDNAEALAGIAQTHIALNQLAEADAASERLLRIAPALAQAHRLRGEVFRRQRRFLSAEQSLREAIRLDPDEPLGHHFLAVVHYEQKEFRKALRAVEEGREIAPWYDVLAAQQALIVLVMKGPKAAEPYADEALRLHGGGESYVLVTVARVMLMAGKLEKARDLVEEVLRRDANDEDAISLYLLTDPNRYRLLRWRAQFPFWRRSHGVFGWIAWLGVWTVLLVALIVVAVAGQVPAIVVAVAYQLFWRAQYSAHRRQVKKHFAQPQLKQDY